MPALLGSADEARSSVDPWRSCGGAEHVMPTPQGSILVSRVASFFAEKLGRKDYKVRGRANHARTFRVSDLALSCLRLHRHESDAHCKTQREREPRSNL